jgi:CheY-like chemotaxis protein
MSDLNRTQEELVWELRHLRRRVEELEASMRSDRDERTSAGAVVEIARNGKEAVGAVNASQFDAVLMDIQMPEMDGYEATRAIRADERFKKLPIIAMTAHAMAGDREKSLQSGMKDHIAKPINADDLLGTLEKWVRTRTGNPKELQAPAEQPDLSAVEPLIRNLYGLLERRNLGATHIAQELAEAVRDLQSSKKAGLLLNQISSLEYENARKTLILLAKELGVPVGRRLHGQ